MNAAFFDVVVTQQLGCLPPDEVTCLSVAAKATYVAHKALCVILSATAQVEHTPCVCPPASLPKMSCPVHSLSTSLL
jgi:hypothetical protein